MDHLPTFNPDQLDLPTLHDFRRVFLAEVRKILCMASKTCELDLIPTNILKECIGEFLQPIADIINISLEQGAFASDWKSVIVRPLLKKPGLDPVLSNYSPQRPSLIEAGVLPALRRRPGIPGVNTAPSRHGHGPSRF